MTTTAPVQDETTTATVPATTPEGSSSASALLEQDLLVEDVSIDGMCGVY